MSNRLLLVAVVAAGLLSLLCLLPMTPAAVWSRPSVAADDCAVPSSVGASQPSNGRINAAFNVAGFNGLFPGHQYFGLMAQEKGPADDRDLEQPYAPPTLLKAIGWIEASWRQGDGDGAPVISPDCGYGIMQITSPGVSPLEGIGMVQPSPDPDVYDDVQVPIARSYTHNIAFGTKTLISKWNQAPEWRPLVGNGNPALLEHWYYAVWSYNGFVSSNHPDDASHLRGEYSCNVSDDFNHNRTEFPYQELVFGCVKHPPATGGVELWPPIAVSLPASVPPFDWENPQTMDIPTPKPTHRDPTSGTLPAPITIDAPPARAIMQPFTVTGWSVDYTTPSGTGIDVIHVYATPVDAAGAATGDRVYVGRATLGGSRPDVATTFGNPSFVSSGYNLNVPGLRPGRYRLVVKAHSTVVGKWYSAYREVELPKPATPAIVWPTHRVTANLPVTLDWRYVPGVDRYQVERWDNLKGGSVVKANVSKLALKDTEFDIKNWWRLRACKGARCSPWSDWRYFRADLAEPTVVWPTNASNPRLPVTLDWRYVPGADRYEVERWDSVEGSRVVEAGASKLALNDAQVNIRNWWRVRACQDSHCGPWSDWLYFKASLAVPTVVWPSNGITAGSLPVTLDWRYVPGATSYQVKRYDLVKGERIVPATVSKLAVADVQASVKNWWRVHACQDGRCGPWSKWRYFSYSG